MSIHPIPSLPIRSRAFHWTSYWFTYQILRYYCWVLQVRVNLWLYNIVTILLCSSAQQYGVVAKKFPFSFPSNSITCISKQSSTAICCIMIKQMQVDNLTLCAKQDYWPTFWRVILQVCSICALTSRNCWHRGVCCCSAMS